jgi:hypothetical protein
MEAVSQTIQQTSRFRTLSDLLPRRGSAIMTGAIPNPGGSGHESDGETPKPWDVFTPTQPLSLGPLFVGRDTHLRRLVAATAEERAHLVLFGDRGRGKTSLAQAFTNVMADAGYVVRSWACGSTTTFEDLCRGLLGALPARITGVSPLPDGPFQAAQTIEALRHLRGSHLILLIDEFDRVQSESLRRELAETIKGLSDAKALVTVLVVGVAQSLEELLGQHPSIQRAIVGVHLAPMDARDIRRMIVSGAAVTRIGFPDRVIDAITVFARGMPYYAHLLCLYVARAARARGGTEVTMADLREAVRDALAKHALEPDSLHVGLLDNPEMLDDVVFAAASVPVDEYGWFAPIDLTRVSVDNGRMLERSAVADGLERLAEARILLQKNTPLGRLYRFAQPSLAHHTLFQQADRRGLLTTDDIGFVSVND